MLAPQRRNAVLRCLALAALVSAPCVAPGADGEKPKAKGTPRIDLSGDPLPEGAVARLGTVRLRHPRPVEAVGFSPDGKLLISAGNYGSIHFWDPASGQQSRPPVTMQVPAHWALAIVQGGKVLLWRRGGQSLALYDLGAGQATSIEAGASAEYFALAPDGKTFVVSNGRHAKNLSLWTTAPGKLLRRFESAHNAVRKLAISPNGKLLAVGTSVPAGGILRIRVGSTLGIWDMASGKRVRSLSHDVYASALAFSPDSKTLAVGSPQEISFWDVATGELRHKVKAHGSFVTCLAFSADGKTLASAANGKEVGSLRGEGDHVILVWDTTAGKVRQRLALGPDRAQAMTFSPDGKKLAAAGLGTAVRLWDMTTGRELFGHSGHQDQVTCLAFAPNGKALASGGGDGVLFLWDPATGRTRRRLTAHLSMVPAVAFRPDGKMLASAGMHDVIRLWDPASGRALGRLKGHRGQPATLSLAFGRDGTLASGGGDGMVRLWDTAKLKELRELAGHKGEVMRLAFSPDGSKLASGVGDSWGQFSLRLWDLTEAKKHRWLQTKLRVNGLVFAPDGRSLLSLHTGMGLKLWDTATGQPIPTALDGKEVWGTATTAIGSPDGRTLATGEYEGYVVLWEVVTGQERRRFVGHRGPGGALAFGPDGRPAPGRMPPARSAPVAALAFSPDGRTVASAADDTTILVWDVASRIAGRPPPALAVLWDDLASRDAARAYASLWALADMPGRTVPFLKEHLRPIPADIGQRIARLIVDLDSKRFAVRQAAMKELEKLDDAAVPALRRGLADKLSLEAHRRVEVLLAKQVSLSAEGLRALRAVEALEHIGTPGARQVLQALAKGLPEARLTRAARASVERLVGSQKHVRGDGHE
jgi:WD40 repeat protein